MINPDGFTIHVDSDKLLLDKQVKYLHIWIRNDLILGHDILELCGEMQMFLHLMNIFPSLYSLIFTNPT